MSQISIGSNINRYEIKEIIHQSDLIVFCKAYDTKLERFVFLRVILHSGDYSDDSREYFISESKILAKLNHKSISKVLDFGKHEDLLYLVSEYIPGKKLTEFLDTVLDWKVAVKMLIPIVEALDYAHQKGIIHRDLNPDNIIISNENQPVLCDFSLMRIIELEETRDMTGTNVGLGNPEYISPEQGKGLEVDFRSDMYSLGVIFFEMVTGKKPFNAENSMEIIIQHVAAQPPNPLKLNPNLPSKVVTIILKLLNKDAGKRFVSMNELLSNLRILIDKPGTENTQPRKIIFKKFAPLAIFAATLILVSWFLTFNQNRIFSKETNQPNNELPRILSISTQISSNSQTVVASTPTKKTSLDISSNTSSITSSITKIPFLNNLELSKLPALQDQKLPIYDEQISLENISRITEIGQWGIPKFAQFAWIPETNLLVAGSSAGIYILDPEDFKVLGYFNAKGWINSISVSTNGKLIATGDTRGNIGVWELISGKNVMYVNAHQNEITSLDFSPDSTKLVSAGKDVYIRLWDINQKLLLSETKKHAIRINKVSFSPNGKHIYSAGDDFQIMVWDGLSGSFIQKMQASQKINDFSLNESGSILAAALNNASIELWNMQTYQKMSTISGWQYTFPFRSIAFFPADGTLVAASDDGLIHVFNRVTLDRIWVSSNNPLKDEFTPVTSISNFALSHDGNLLISLSKDGRTVLWDMTTNNVLSWKDFVYSPINRIELAKNDLKIAYQSGQDNVETWSLNPPSRVFQVQGILPKGKCFSPDNKMLSIFFENLLLYPISYGIDEPKNTLYGYVNNSTINYFLDSKIIAISYPGNNMVYWSTSSGKELAPAIIRFQNNCRVLFDSEDKFLAAGSMIGITESPGNYEAFCKISRSPRTLSEDYLDNGSMIAFSMENGKFEIWNIEFGNSKSIFQSELSKGDLLDVSISPDGQMIALGSEDGYLEIYDSTSGGLIYSVLFETGPVNQVVFSNMGNFIVIGLEDGTLRFLGLDNS